MSADRELLEAAAKAAGYTVHGSVGDRFIVNFGFGERGEWNPLTGDGDALRLAVKLEIDVTFRVVGASRVEALPPGGPRCAEAYEHAYQRGAATCRAIVRAAAALASH